MSIDPNDKIKPWLQGQFAVLVAQDLEAKRSALSGRMSRFLGRLGVETPDESVQSTKHAAISGLVYRRSEAFPATWWIGGMQTRQTPSRYQFIALYLNSALLFYYHYLISLE